jgi:hypothetical protein
MLGEGVVIEPFANEPKFIGLDHSIMGGNETRRINSDYVCLNDV